MCWESPDEKIKKTKHTVIAETIQCLIIFVIACICVFRICSCAESLDRKGYYDSRN